VSRDQWAGVAIILITVVGLVLVLSLIPEMAK
jgi:hypothetical protein